MVWQNTINKWQKKNGVVFAGETRTGIYYEVRGDGTVYEDLGGSFNLVHRASDAEEGKAWVDKRTKPHVDEDFPDGFPW